MGGSDSGGGDSYGGSSYDDAPMNYARKKREEKKVREIEDIRAGGGAFGTGETNIGRSLYARSESGNLIRSSSGSAVTSRAGRQVVENVRASMEGRPARDMSAELAAMVAQDDSPDPITPQPKTVTDTSEPRESTDLSKAARRATAQAQKGAKARIFYGNKGFGL